MDPVEGFYLEDDRGTIFAVKGIMHPNKKYIVVPRYVRSKTGERGTSSRYVKLPSSNYKLSMERWPHLKQLDPYMGIEVLAMEGDEVKKIYDPISKLDEIRKDAPTPLHEACIRLSKMLEERGVDGNRIGVTGSILLGLEKKSSDIDLVVYGFANSVRAYEAMRHLRHEELTIPIKGREGNPMRLPIEAHLAHERRKLLKGVLLLGERQFDYLLRCIPLKEEYVERYGEARHIDLGPVKLEAKVIEDKFGFLVPTRYSIQTLDCNCMDVVSYGGVICEQAKKGERVLVSGKLEKRVDVVTGRTEPEIVVDMGGHYLYDPELADTG
jgi:predicted nucleotidyltransferase